MTNFSFPVRIYIEDTDAGGIVYYANYLRYMERCRSEWLRQCGVSQEILRHQDILFVVAEAALKYHRPARLDEALEVTLTVTDMGKARLRICHEVFRLGEDAPQLLVTGTVTVACMSAAGKPKAIPAEVREKIDYTDRQSG
ncbi:tol-pal system-associated acyl-CoA thioesterase [Parathalassolituus penaei]|uniref:Tol-pal system-associated acyl-CoA thioesterase n=1 Tax=Parathalassolituus penaei TaxID=2997323 RepID=A0A9X3EA03_9GAMM|nr:tol-pal system-associated acyl-CoA thioesterase [Parathalassolituus penaei]MCY0963633.1 tol-pal system-associated acyl-CoA thioesterase [Parathalassolituus penaei]